MCEAPSEWRARAGTIFPSSDPAPSGKVSGAPQWDQPAWQDLATTALARGWVSHLTLLDDEGYPIPLRTRDVTAGDGGFRIVMPKALPWSEGKATLSFMGWNLFVGDVTLANGVRIMEIERALPILPLTKDASEVLKPSDYSRKSLDERLRYESERRDQPIPIVPKARPPPTELAYLRAAHAHEWKPMKDT
jgi:hypothetical protein